MNPCRLSIAFALLVVGCSAATSHDREELAELCFNAFDKDHSGIILYLIKLSAFFSVN